MRTFIIILLSFFSLNTVFAQKKLEVQGEKDERSVSIKMQNGAPSSRVIVESTLTLAFTTNMGNINSGDIEHEVINGIQTYTIYFFLPPNDNKRRLVVSSQGFSSVRIDLTLLPKETYRYIIFDPTEYNKESDFSALAKGDSEAQFVMAQNYANGTNGFTKSDVQAVEWYEKAAAQANRNAQYLLGSIYANGGVDVKVDMAKSAKWYLEAAKQNNMMAQYIVAEYYTNGTGFIKSMPNAVQWYRAAAKNGYVKAQYNLALILLNGNGVARSDTEAFQWFKSAAEHHHTQSQYHLGVMYCQGEGTVKDVDTGVEWLQKAIAQNDQFAMYYLGKLYATGNGVPVNEINGVALLRQSSGLGCVEATSFLAEFEKTKSDQQRATLTKDLAEKGDPQAQHDLAEMYAKGVGIAMNQATAATYYLKSAQQGYLEAMVAYAKLLESGVGVAKNPSEALDWYKKAADQDDAPAYIQFLVGKACQEGKFGAIDHNQAFSYFLKASSKYYGDAIYKLGRMYELGLGCVKDIKKAIYYYELAYAREQVDAETALKRLKAPLPTLHKLDQMLKYFTINDEVAKKNTQAILTLADMYKYGNDYVLKNEAKYQELLQQAESLGSFTAKLRLKFKPEFIEIYNNRISDNKALLTLSDCYCSGNLIMHDQREAIRWYLIALKSGMRNSDLLKSVIKQKYDLLAYEYHSSDNENIFPAYLLDSVNHPDYGDMGDLYFKGKIGRNYLYAVYLYEKNIEKTPTHSSYWKQCERMLNMSYMYYYGGYGLTANLQEALLWATNARELYAKAKYGSGFKNIKNQIDSYYNFIKTKIQGKTPVEPKKESYYEQSWTSYNLTDTPIEAYYIEKPWTSNDFLRNGNYDHLLEINGSQNKYQDESQAEYLESKLSKTFKEALRIKGIKKINEFTTYGVVIGKTTFGNLAARGYKYTNRLLTQDFKCQVGCVLFETPNTARGIIYEGYAELQNSSMPPEWIQYGFCRDLSTEQWAELFEHLGFKVVAGCAYLGETKVHIPDNHNRIRFEYGSIYGKLIRQ